MSPSSRSSLCVVLAYEPLDSFYTTGRVRIAAAQGPEKVAGRGRRAGATSTVANAGTAMFREMVFHRRLDAPTGQTAYHSQFRRVRQVFDDAPFRVAPLMQ